MFILNSLLYQTKMSVSAHLSMHQWLISKPNQWHIGISRFIQMLYLKCKKHTHTKTQLGVLQYPMPINKSQCHTFKVIGVNFLSNVSPLASYMTFNIFVTNNQMRNVVYTEAMQNIYEVWYMCHLVGII